MKKLAIILFIIVPGLAGAQSGFRLRRPLRVDHDDRTIPQPATRRVSDIYAIVNNTWLRHLNPEKGVVAKGPALNVNAWDDVPDSSWFTNRIGLRPLRFPEIADGIEGKPPGRPPWRVIERNDGGYTPKVDIDSAGRYVLKFDPKGARERNSGAERIGTLILYAAGYNVPHNTIVYFRPTDLLIDKASKYEDPFGSERPLTRDFLDGMLRDIDPMPDGRYRGIASLFLPPPILGPFVFTGRRPDDPNDIIPHERRRELRGLRVIGSWINHVDIKDAQALDIFHTAPDGRKFVKHYLIDFSATLGAYEWPSAPFRMGHEYMFDGAAMARSFVSLGLWRRPWEIQGKVQHNEIGYFDAELFDPAKWKPSFPNLAFEQMDDGDAYWGAKIVTAFTDDLIDQLARAGEYSRPEVTAYVADVLKKRRDAIGKYWFDRITPLEEIVLLGPRLDFRDLAVERGYAVDAFAKSRTYRYHVEDLNGRRLTPDQVGRFVEIPELAEIASKTAEQPADTYGRIPLLKVLVQSQKALPVEVILGRATQARSLQVLGWTHAPR